MRCDTCQQLRKVTITYGVKAGRRHVEWTICVPCELRERQDADARMRGAIAQAEAAGV